MRRFLVGSLGILVFAFAAVAPGAAADIALYPGERRSQAGEYVVCDLGGAGKTLVFVEIGASRTECLCEAAVAASSSSHAYLVRLPAGASDGEKRKFLFLTLEGLGGGELYLVSTSDTDAPCCDLARARPTTVAGVVNLSSDLAAKLAPKEIAMRAIGYVAKRAGEETALSGKFRKPGWSGWTLE